MHRQSLITCALGLAALFTPGFLPVASADVVNLYNFDVILNGNPVFTDNFSTGTLAGGSGLVLPAGPTYSDGSTALYQVIGTLQETGAPPASKAVLDDPGAGRGHGERDLAADAAARAGHHRHLAFHHTRHAVLLCYWRLTTGG
jgi:hypothetical protein